jgi:hypothetical protein
LLKLGYQAKDGAGSQVSDLAALSDIIGARRLTSEVISFRKATIVGSMEKLEMQAAIRRAVLRPTLRSRKGSSF